MKKKLNRIGSIVFILMLGLISNAVAQIKWLSIEKAQTLAAATEKPIFIELTAEWCGWCKKMDKTTFKNEEVANILNNEFYSVKLNFDSKVYFQFKGKDYTSKSLAKEYGIEGLPTMIIISKDLNRHSLIVGYQKSKQLKSKLINKVDNM